MRSFFFGTSDGQKAAEEHNGSQPDRFSQPIGTPERLFPSSCEQTTPTTRPCPKQRKDESSGFMSAFHNITRVAADAEMERRVSVAARNLGDGVQKIVMAAKGSSRQSGGSQGEWKSQLLQLLGGGDDQAGMFSNNESDIDVLLENSRCDKFVLRCVENELPPNLIHCLRLLRVLELQHANAHQQQQQSSAISVSNATSMSTGATAKVSELLCLLCTDSSVGEQLKPHLFGLLALSGASYPTSGIHVANAASKVIISFAESCLSASLVWFLHDRKMIVHMTDDIKELCGMSEVSSSTSASLCLYGSVAEEAGLWVVALRTIVHLVVFSCHHQCLELLNDFDAAGGYHVLCYAIANSNSGHAKMLMELVTTLACCRTESDPKPSDMDGETSSSIGLDDNEKEDEKRVTNPAACDIIEDLMVQYVPLLKEFDQVYGGERPEISSEESLRELATFSLRTALNVRFAGMSSSGSDPFDLAMELLVTALQMYSDHAQNYDIIEERHSILSYYLLAFPTFEDVSLKVLILKTLEYVCTGVAGTDAVKPLTVTSEIFFALCKSLLKGANGIELDSEEEAKIYDSLLMDADMMCDTIEKLLEFDDRVSDIMLEGGILSSKLNDVLDLVKEATENRQTEDFGYFEEASKIFTTPPASTPLDRVFSAICRVLKLVVIQTSGQQAASNPFELEVVDGNNSQFTSKLIELLISAVKELGARASHAALGVFDSMLSAQVSRETLTYYLRCIIDVLLYFAETTGRLLMPGIFLVDAAQPTRMKKPTRAGHHSIKHNPMSVVVRVHSHIIEREASIFSMLKSVLEFNDSAKDVFRTTGGFECVCRVTLCLEGLFNDREVEHIDESIEKAAEEMLDSAFGLLCAAVGKSRKHSQSEYFGEMSSSPNSVYLPAENVFSEPLSYTGAAGMNLRYVRQKGFYTAFARAIASTGILRIERAALSVLKNALAYVDPNLKLSDMTNASEKDSSIENGLQTQSRHASLILNPDVSRLFIGLAMCLPTTDYGIALSKCALDEMLRLCSPKSAGSTLAQLANCGLCWSITNRNEFASMLLDRSHHLYSRFVLLLRRIAIFSMSYTDFVGLLRCIAGPILMSETKVDAGGYLRNRIKLPVISSSVRTSNHQLSQEIKMSDAWQAKETDFCTNLETLCVIAERGDRTPRCELGGAITNTESTKVEDCPDARAQDGRASFLEIRSIDASSLSPSGASTAGIPAPSNHERIWAPLASSGFTYSIWLRLALPHHETSSNSGNVFILDLSSPPEKKDDTGQSTGDKGGEAGKRYLSLWYDIAQQRFTVLSSGSHRNEPICFPVSHMRSGVWHHVLLAYLPPKRPMLSRKAVLGMFVDGRPLEAEVRVESVNLPPNTRVFIGVPNPFFADANVLGGTLPSWDLGPSLMISTLLSNRDATAIFAAGPDFQGMFWGDRPQRLSLTATATTAFAMLAESGEQGSVAGALRRRGVPEVEAAGHVMRERSFSNGHIQGSEADSLAAVNLLCSIPPEYIVFGYRAASSFCATRDDLYTTSTKHFPNHLVNVARINSSNEAVSTDAVVHGNGSVISPSCFADNVQWIGGPNVLMPLINAARSTRSLALALCLIRESVRRHPPSLEMLQAGGGYRMMGVLLRQKRIMDESVLDQCFAFAVHGFEPQYGPEKSCKGIVCDNGKPSWPSSDKWVFADLDAMKYLLLNHQVWDMRASRPDLPLRLLSFLNGLVAQHSAHKAFNSRRLHLLGIVRWTLHLMLEAAELFTSGEMAVSAQICNDSDDETSLRFGSNQTGKIPFFQGNNSSNGASVSHGWYVDAPSVASTAVGGDPDNTLLLACKTLLRRVLTFMLTPGDLEAIADAAIYTVSIVGPTTKVGGGERDKQHVGKTINHDGEEAEDEKLLPGAVARVYLLRLIEELVVDGVNEIVAAGDDKKGSHDSDGPSEPAIQPHAGGGASATQSYLATSMLARRRRCMDGSVLDDFTLHPKHQQAQAFLQAFGGVLTPIWFACLLEGCHEEASASAVLRLMILMLQSSPMFATAFEDAGGFAPLVLSIPKFSTCPSITLSMLSQLLHAPILHLPCFGVLVASQLCEVFDAESDATELIMKESIQGNLNKITDPSCGIFALLAECLGRNIQLAPFDNDLGRKARQTNEAVLHLLSHRHRFSSAFQEFCRTADFLEPLAQALCLVHDEKIQRMHQEIGQNSPGTYDPHTLQRGTEKRMKRRGSLSEVPRNETPTERFVGRPGEDTESSGIGMVELLHLVVHHAVLAGPYAAPLVSALFRSFPIHASPEQVEAFHMVLIEHCRSVVEDALQHGEPIAIANCVGVSSVLLDRLVAGFFTSEPVLEAVRIALLILNCLATCGTYASRVLSSSDQVMLAADAAHFARFTSVKALQRSRPMGAWDEGDEDLKLVVLDSIRENMEALLIIPVGNSNQVPRRQPLMGGGPSNSSHLVPLPGSRLHQLWESASFSRCATPSLECMYRDLTAMTEPERAFVVALMGEIHPLLSDSREEMRGKAVSIVVILLQKRRGIMSDLLITDAQCGDHIETIDLMNRGGFGALLVAHEAASLAESAGTVYRQGSVGSMLVPKRKYASFFEWLERNRSQVDAVFQVIQTQTKKVFPEGARGAATPEEAIENEQKVMLLKLTSQDSSDRTILGGLERAELAQRCYDKTSESHALWKRQGFDDLSSGAMQWKFLLRQLKGSCSVWEGGMADEQFHFSSKNLLRIFTGDPSRKLLEEDKSGTPKLASLEVVTRWKLDLTEGYERQRRRLLPNYEFHSLYNINETVDHGSLLSPNEEREREKFKAKSVNSSLTPSGKVSASLLETGQQRRRGTVFEAESMEATAALLRDLNLKTIRKGLDDDYYEDDLDVEVDDDESQTLPESISAVPSDIGSVSESITTQFTSRPDGRDIFTEVPCDSVGDEKVCPDQVDSDGSSRQDNVLASSYDLITGLLQAGDWPEKSYNINRCTGLEVRKGLLLWCHNAIYIIDGFEQTDGEGLEGKINRLEKENATFYINLRPQDFKASDGSTHYVVKENNNHSLEMNRFTSDRDKARESLTQDSSEEVTYQHRSQRIAFNDLYSVFRRRYQLQQVALELYDVHRSGTLIAFSNSDEREEVLSKILNSPLPNSIFQISGYGSTINYKKFMSNWKHKIVKQWVEGKITNFDLLMHLNSFAGRSYNDLTQYPVFPWVIADYESEELDFNNRSTYRDLLKPMGALGESRAEQFKERYETLKVNYLHDETEYPPFHYGTHYSCSAYVVGYLMRLEPFSRLALSLQGGRFDVADRLFYNIGYSWKSASKENLQDVRELIPEFFYLPEFLMNSNGFDFGVTQSGNTVHDVILPPWAKGDPKRFVRYNRLALESEYVSKNLHHWIDLIFGYKQQGREAEIALNAFVPVTYEGAVDLEEMEDPIKRESTIAQIQNFGQTPSRLERRPFPARIVAQAVRDKSIDFGSLSYLAPLTPPFCVVGAPPLVSLRVSGTDVCRVGMTGQSDSAVGDMCLVRGQIVGVGRTCALIIPQKKYYRFGGPNNGVSVHVASPTARHREINKMLSIHDGMHRAPISVAKASNNGMWLVTGCSDSTVRVWRFESQKIELRATLCGHEGGKIKCIDVSTIFGTIVTGCTAGNILLWDLRTLTFVRRLQHSFEDIAENQPGPYSGFEVVSVSINHKNGNIVTLVGGHLSVFDINGCMLATQGPREESPFTYSEKPSCAVATDCPEWMESGIIAITGHLNGEIRLWRLDYEREMLVMCHIMRETIHSCPISALRIYGGREYGDRQDTLLVGDTSGKVSVCKTVQLENLNQVQLSKILQSLRDGTSLDEIQMVEDRRLVSSEGGGLMGLLAGTEL